MPTEWGITDFGLTGLVFAGIVYVVVTYIKTAKIGSGDDKSKTAQHVCANSLIPYITDSIKINSELVTVLRDQQQSIREQQTTAKQSADKQQEVMQGMVIAINNLVALSKETLERVKDIERGS